MEREGYFDAKVDYAVAARDVEGAKSGKKTSEEIITIRYNAGPATSFSRIEFDGNRYFSTDLLKRRISISTVSLFTRPHFSRRLMDADALSMKKPVHFERISFGESGRASGGRAREKRWRLDRPLQH